MTPTLTLPPCMGVEGDGRVGWAISFLTDIVLFSIFL